VLKGIKKSVVKKDIDFQNYYNALHNNTVLSVNMNNFRSINHRIGTQTINKTALTAYNDKNYILDDGINTLSFGHYKILEHTMNQQ
jgi:hypothetical protein